MNWYLSNGIACLLSLTVTHRSAPIFPVGCKGKEREPNDWAKEKMVLASAKHFFRTTETRSSRERERKIDRPTWPDLTWPDMANKHGARGRNPPKPANGIACRARGELSWIMGVPLLGLALSLLCWQHEICNIPPSLSKKWDSNPTQNNWESCLLITLLVNLHCSLSPSLSRLGLSGVNWGMCNCATNKSQSRDRVSPGSLSSNVTMGQGNAKASS